MLDAKIKFYKLRNIYLHITYLNTDLDNFLEEFSFYLGCTRCF